MKIAVIGSGISGLVCAHLLDPGYQLTLFEAGDYVGGHTHTVDIPLDGQTVAVDTGFIVFNDRTYPHFMALLERLGVAIRPTEMSFSVHHPGSGLEYNGHNLNSLFAQRRNLLRPRFYRLIGEILRFNRLARGVDPDGAASQATLADFLAEHRFSGYFAEHYLLPMGAAIWSTSLAEFSRFPLGFFLRFFNNHGLLQVTDRPQWYVVEGGSREYVRVLTDRLRAPVRLNTPVAAITRHADGVRLQLAHGAVESFDEVILACHSDQALALLADASAEEQRLLGTIGYRDNEVVLHRDTRLLPRQPRAWASWNYRLAGSHDNTQPATVTYWMNRLQGLEGLPTLCVTLNSTEQIAPERVVQRFRYAHPQFSVEALAAQQRRGEICGHNRTHFCGAYWYNGFHEDGVRSALDVCRRFGVAL